MIDLVFNVCDYPTEVAVKMNSLWDVGELSLRGNDHGGPSSIVIITDEQVGSLYGQTLRDGLARSGVTIHELRVPPGEGSKSLAAAERAYRFLSEKAVGRDGLILALGGGVVSDLAGFVAATWMRGIAFAICPTTLESAIDASLGGKTAINLDAAKNLVGAFHQPRFVLIDPVCLTTLEPRDVRAGLAESVKHALISSESFLAWHEAQVDAILALEPTVVTELIIRNLKVKGGIVEEDALERSGKRMLLNFGHTIGHAIESCSDYRLRHGECVALGMVAACRLSTRVGLLDQAMTSRIETLMARLELPTQLHDPPRVDAILAGIARDKKAQSGRARFVLLGEVGHPVIRNDISDSQIRDAYASLS